VKLRLVPQGHDYFQAFSEIAANLDAAAALLAKLMTEFSQAKIVAREILERVEGPPAPQDWAGWMKAPYRIGATLGLAGFHPQLARA